MIAGDWIPPFGVSRYPSTTPSAYYSLLNYLLAPCFLGNDVHSRSLGLRGSSLVSEMLSPIFRNAPPCLLYRCSVRLCIAHLSVCGSSSRRPEMPLPVKMSWPARLATGRKPKVSRANTLRLAWHAEEPPRGNTRCHLLGIITCP